MKNSTNAAVIGKEVDNLLRGYGLSHVVDNVIGTVFIRALRNLSKLLEEVLVLQSQLLTTSAF